MDTRTYAGWTIAALLVIIALIGGGNARTNAKTLSVMCAQLATMSPDPGMIPNSVREDCRNAGVPLPLRPPQ